MTPAELRAMLQRDKFVPFRVYLSDGAHYDVRKPYMAMMGMSTLILGVVRNIEHEFFDEPVFISLRQITRIEPIIETAAPAGSNGTT